MNPPVGLDGVAEVTPVGLDMAVIQAKADAENFPVAMRVLPRPMREQLLAIYSYARLVDEVGDRVPGDRLAQLDWVESELDRAWSGTASHPVFSEVGRLAASSALTEGPSST